jgi:predicted dehydrogenase
MSLVVGMVGLTHPHTAMHLRTLGALARVDGVVLCDPDSAARERVAAEFPKTAGVVGDLDALLARPDVPVVLIAVPNDRAPAVIARAAEAGKHVLAEKPCARSAAELRPAVDATARRGTKFGVFYTWRANPAMRKLRALIQQGAIGRLISAELRMVTTQVAVRDPSHWLFKRDVAGGGIASWLGGHWLDLLRYVSGEEVDQVVALTGIVGGPAIDVEDLVSASLRLSDGGIASFYAGYLLAHGKAGYEGADYDRAFLVRGTTGNIAYAEEENDLILALERAAPTADAGREIFRFSPPPSPAYGGAPGLAFVEEFLDAALTGVGDGPAPIEAAQRVLEILDAIYESAATGRVAMVKRLTVWPRPEMPSP